MTRRDVILQSKAVEKLDAINDRNHFLFINFLTIAGSLLLCIFGINSLLETKYILAAAIFSTSIIGLINLAAFAYHRNFQITAFVLGLVAISFCIYLTIFGGNNQTGPIWVFPIMLVAIFINKVKQGTFLALIFIFVCLSMLINAENGLVNNMYTIDATIRFIVSVTALSIFSIFLGYLQENSQKNLEKLHLKLEEAANVDPLTQLYNRHFIIENFLKK